MNILLMGYRGSGKTTIGRKLADELWKTFVDTDQATCQRLGNRTIKQVWDEMGEPVWRKTECEVTAEVLQKDNQVIAIGGGTAMQPAAREAIEKAEHLTCIYLRCEPPELLRRVQGDTQTAATRPNLTNLGGGIDEIRQMLSVREPVYLALARHTLDVTRLMPPDAVRHLIRRCL